RGKETRELSPDQYLGESTYGTALIEIDESRQIHFPGGSQFWSLVVVTRMRRGKKGERPFALMKGAPTKALIDRRARAVSDMRRRYWGALEKRSLLKRSSKANKVDHRAATGASDDDCDATWRCSDEVVLWRDHEHGPTGFADRWGRSGDGSEPRLGRADRYGVLAGRRKNG